MQKGSVLGIYIGSRPSAPLDDVQEVRAVAGRGLEGDRYFAREGTYSRGHGPQRQVTLIEAEALDALQRDYGITLGPGESRRNIVTRGIALNHLVGSRFRVGEVELHGVKLCEPCKHLESLTKPGVRRALVHRGGLNAEILSDGVIRVGDEILAG